MFIVVALMLSCLARHAHATCSVEEDTAYMSEQLGEDCRSNLSLLKFKKPAIPIDENKLNSVCTPACLGKYTGWLNSRCNDTAKAWFYRAACLKQHDKQVNKRCRLFFPDFTNITSARQCWTPISGSNPTSCSLECRNQLQELISRLGCCFETIYDNRQVTEGLFKQGFLSNEEFVVLKTFQDSDILRLCANTIPQACIGEFFIDGGGDTSGAAGFRSSSSLFAVYLTILATAFSLFTYFL